MFDAPCLIIGIIKPIKLMMCLNVFVWSSILIKMPYKMAILQIELLSSSKMDQKLNTV